jgi:uncharacterized protein
MGEIIGIREETSPLHYRIWFTTTGEERTVTVDADKHELFLGQDIKTVRPMACPFLRQSAPGTFICSVHDSRPDLCRQYSCFRILVLDPQGKRIGRVMDASRYFTTLDPVLHELWQNEIAGVEILNEQHWEEHVDTVLTHAGYRLVK